METIALVILITFFAVFNAISALTGYKRELAVGIVFYWISVSIYWISRLAEVI
jgi:hypothetical protein